MEQGILTRKQGTSTYVSVDLIGIPYPRNGFLS